MSRKEFFQTIETSGTASFKDRGSRFLAYAFPLTDLADFKEKIAALKKEHPKANHICFAYRLGTDENQFRVSDAGEPSGTAGRPILGQIDSRELTDILVVVVRYFGGTLLGVPGLINAYKSAASLVLQVIPIVRKPVLVFYQVQFDYTKMNEVMLIVRQTGCVIRRQDLQLFCLLDLGIPLSKLTEVLYRFADLRDVTLQAVQDRS